MPFKIQNPSAPQPANREIASKLISPVNPQPVNPSGTFSTDELTLVSWIQWAPPPDASNPLYEEIGTVRWEWEDPDGNLRYQCHQYGKDTVDDTNLDDYITYSMIPFPVDIALYGPPMRETTSSGRLP